MNGGDDERPRRSWREIDRMRDGSGHRPDERKPRGKAAEARSRQAAQTYLKQIDGLFAQDGGGAESERLARLWLEMTHALLLSIVEQRGGRGSKSRADLVTVCEALLAKYT